MPSSLYFEIIDSTSAYLLEHSGELDDFSFVRADYQSAGKGRGGHTWLSQKGENLLFSFLIKRQDLLEQSERLSLLVGVALAKFFKNQGYSDAQIKWPNDLLLGGKKFVGILLQGRLPEYVVIGIGINCNQTNFEGEYRIPPTSLKMQSKRDVDVNSLYEALQKDLIDFFGGDRYLSALYEYASFDALYGKRIEATYQEEALKGIACGIDSKGRLLVKKDDGTIVAVSSGEVHQIHSSDQ